MQSETTQAPHEELSDRVGLADARNAVSDFVCLLKLDDTAMKHLILFCGLILPVTLHAENKTWVGATGNWSAAGLWSPNNVPGTLDHVFISNTSPASLVTLDVNPTITGLSMNGSTIPTGGSHPFHSNILPMLP